MTVKSLESYDPSAVSPRVLDRMKKVLTIVKIVMDLVFYLVCSEG